MSKMGSHYSFRHLKHKLWPKEGRELNCQFDSRPQKVGNRLDLLSCRGRATYCWKGLDESYNFAIGHIAIQGFLAKLWGSKVAGVPFVAISGLPLGSPGKNSHLDVASVESCRVYYKGEATTSLTEAIMKVKGFSDVGRGEKSGLKNDSKFLHKKARHEGEWNRGQDTSKGEKPK